MKNDRPFVAFWIFALVLSLALFVGIGCIVFEVTDK